MSICYKVERRKNNMKTIVIITKNGRIIRFNTSEVSIQMIGGIGYTAMTIEQGDEVVAAFVMEDQKI